ncbi:Hypothetical Protein FCC1311_098322 [Hondaea fermentalgiana]|uniref:Uncharacterized protein n=1 Tax=Hondaea fermentalgiana TaxID=2315210 RepID=A0A2R5GTF8_9STRA|nr:Hypothetical Protein FCC1311_098322 [Hondaea fermentalgiana]|eukprot:GBG33609.1 Hypothetical Protein FCC1311_098322 [Hondaea fermentalgiana]
MGRAETYLIPARFAITTGHLLAVLVLYYHISVLHFLGAIYTSWFVLNSWNYEMYWKIAGIFSIVPALVELGILLNIFVFRAIPY